MSSKQSERKKDFVEFYGHSEDYDIETYPGHSEQESAKRLAWNAFSAGYQKATEKDRATIKDMLAQAHSNERKDILRKLKGRPDYEELRAIIEG